MVLTVRAALVAGGWVLWASCALGWALLALALIDGRDGVLPDALTLPLHARTRRDLLFGADTVDRQRDWRRDRPTSPQLRQRWLYARWRHREGIGLGDAKVLAAAGAQVGWIGLPSVILIASVLALASVLILTWRGRKLRGELSIDFGPALCAALWLVWLYGPFD